jgi:hypothetical protein
MSMYVIQDTRHFVGDSVVWWRKNGKGYTTNLDEAGEYEEEEALSIGRSRETDKPIPLHIAVKCVQRLATVDAFRLREALKEEEKR